METEGSSPRSLGLLPVPVLSQMNPVHDPPPHPISWRYMSWRRPEQRSCYSDSLRAGRSGGSIPGRGEIFRIRLWGSPSPYTMGTGYFPWVKRPGRGVDHPRPSSAGVKKRVELHPYSPSGPSWPVLGWTLPLHVLIFHMPNLMSIGSFLLRFIVFAQVRGSTVPFHNMLR